MSEFDLSGIPQGASAIFLPFAQGLLMRPSLGVQSISVVGSCLTGDYIHGVSDINSVLVLSATGIPELDILASMSRFRKKGIRSPLVITEEHISRSLDCFAIEFLDMKLFHKTIYGPDHFISLVIDKAPLRLQCERDLKGKLIHLQRGYVAVRGRPLALKGLLLEALPGFFPLLRAMLYLVRGQDPPALKADVLAQAEETFHTSLAVLHEIRALKASTKLFYSRDHIVNLFREVLRITHELSVATDELPV